MSLEMALEHPMSPVDFIILAQRFPWQKLEEVEGSSALLKIGKPEIVPEHEVSVLL